MTLQIDIDNSSYK